MARLSKQVLTCIVKVLLFFELTGEWPSCIGLYIIVLLPESDGGYRPIGLLPCMVRVWTRARRQAILRWEVAVQRPYLYAGKGMGADVAAWKQAASAELAAAASSKVGYGVALLDLVKAFERVPHHILVRSAIKLGFPMWLLRLSLAAYRLPRVLRLGLRYVGNETGGDSHS